MKKSSKSRPGRKATTRRKATPTQEYRKLFTFMVGMSSEPIPGTDFDTLNFKICCDDSLVSDIGSLLTDANDPDVLSILNGLAGIVSRQK